MPDGWYLEINPLYAKNNDRWEAEHALHEDNCNDSVLKIHVASWDVMAAKTLTALNVYMCVCLRAGGVINNKRAGNVSLRQVHKWWPGHHLLPWEGASCSSSFPWRVKPAIEVWMGCHGRLHCTAVPLPWKLSYAPCQQVLCFPLSVSFSVSRPCPSPSLLIPWIVEASHKCTVRRGFWR